MTQRLSALIGLAVGLSACGGRIPAAPSLPADPQARALYLVQHATLATSFGTSSMDVADSVAFYMAPSAHCCIATGGWRVLAHRDRVFRIGFSYRDLSGAKELAVWLVDLQSGSVKAANKQSAILSWVPAE